MKQAFGLSLFAIISILNFGCGGSDDNIVGTPLASGPSPYPVGCIPGTPGCYPVGGSSGVCNPYNTYVSHAKTWAWPAQQQIFYVANGQATVCANAKVTVQGNSDDNLIIKSGWYETYAFSKAEIAAGKTVQFSQPGQLIYGCAHCETLKIPGINISVAY